MSEENFLADVQKEGDQQDPFADLNKGEENPSESLPEKDSEKVEPDQGDEPEDAPENTDQENVPFHKHPRWMERENELKQLKQDLESAKDQLAQFSENNNSQPSNPDIPEWFSETYGDDPKLWARYQQVHTEQKERIKQELREEAIEAQKQEEEETKHWTNWVGNQIQDLVDNKGLDPKDIDELKNIMLKYKPTNDDNDLDFEAGYELLKLSKTQREAVTKEKVEAKKKVASLTTERSKGDSGKKDYLTNNDLQHRGWTSL